MALPAWWQVVAPHKDIREKSFNEAVFAADLWDVMSGNAPEEYRDPRLFFTRTYITAGLKNLAQNILSRLASGRGDPVVQLQTPFGGGKTHALITLYHLLKSYNSINHLPAVKYIMAGAPPFTGARVAAFVGTAADPLKGRTPWGEIAYQLGCYEVVQDQDAKRVAPGRKLLDEMLRKSSPTLVLIDELLEYIVKANRVEKLERITPGQTLAFLQELTESVKASPNCALVLTLPASALEQYDEEAEKALAQLQKISGRLESIYLPVSDLEIYEVARKRLFENLGDEQIHRQVAEEYFRLYQGLGGEVPAEVRETAYREKIERAYPFHPELIDLLYERWGSFPTFQRTRGVLRLLAEVVGDLYERRTLSPLIHSSQVDLGKTSIRREFLKHIGNEWDGIIAGDVTGRAARIDREMGSEYEKYGIAQGLATAVFLYSFSGSERRGVTLPWLRVALLREGLPPTIVGDAINKLDDTLHYFHREKHLYSFKNVANLNRVIVEREEAIEPAQVREQIRDLLASLGKTSLADVYPWPRSSADIPDNKRLKLAVLSPDELFGGSGAETLAREILEKTGAAPRVYCNTVFVVAADPGFFPALENQTRRLLALRSIAKDKSVHLSESDRQEAQKRLGDAEKDLPYALLATYRHLAWGRNGGVVWGDLGLPPTGQKASLADRALQYLKDESRLLGSVTPKFILEKTFQPEEEEKEFQEVYNLFLTIPGLPCLEGEEVLAAAVRRGVKEKLLGVRKGDALYFGEEVLELPRDALIVRPEKAVAEKLARGKEISDGPAGEGHVKDQYLGPSTGGTGAAQWTVADSSVPAAAAQSQAISLSLKVGLPWDKLSQIIPGVIQPLIRAGAELRVTLEVQATSPVGLDRITLETKVKETLLQLGAEIKEWKEI